MIQFSFFDDIGAKLGSGWMQCGDDAGDVARSIPAFVYGEEGESERKVGAPLLWIMHELLQY